MSEGLDLNAKVPAAWLVRAGTDGERENEALHEGLAILGWEELGDISGCATREELREQVAHAYPGEGKASVANWTGQLWRFMNTMEHGDHIVMPLKTRPPLVAIGQVAGPYRYRSEAPEGFRHVRAVHWIAEVSREDIKQDLLDSMGSLLTVCRLVRFDAARRVTRMVEDGVDPGNPQLESTGYHNRHQLLEDAAQRPAANPVRLTIRELLQHWKQARRTHGVVAVIQTELAEKGLTTRPPFTEGWIDSYIELVPVGAEPVPGVSATPAQVAEDTSDIADLPPATLRIGDLESASQGVASVKPDTLLQAAMTIMLSSDFSQLAVISVDGTYLGAVSWQSIGAARIACPHPELRDAIVSIPTGDFDELLLDKIDQIYDKGFIFVRTPDKTRIGGIVTAADLTRQFGVVARPFVLIEEVERRLRRRVDEVLDQAELRAAAEAAGVRRAKSLESASHLTLGNYPYLLELEDVWKRLEWPIDSGLFINLLRSACEFRNELMHFSLDPLKEELLDKVNSLLRLLRVVDPRP